MSLSHEGMRAAAQATALRADALSSRRATRPAAKAARLRNGRGVFAGARVWHARGRPGALCGDGVSLGRVVQRMHLGRLPVYDVDEEPPVT